MLQVTFRACRPLCTLRVVTTTTMASFNVSTATYLLKKILQKYKESIKKRVLTINLSIHADAGKLWQICLVQAALTKNA
jgi:hypothetical protein